MEDERPATITFVPDRSPRGSVVLIAVGDELLSGHTQDTNSNHLARRLFAAGHPVRRIEVVGDVDGDIAASLQRALAEPGIAAVILCGGIGPTPDDHTFAAVAAALELPIEVNADALAQVQQRVRSLFEQGWLRSPEVSAANHRAAEVPRGAEVIPNRRGMSPAIVVARGEQRVFVLPGIPREFTTIVDEELLPRFFGGGSPDVVRELRYTAVPEAEMYEPMRTLEQEFPDVAVGSYPQTQRRELVIRFRSADVERANAALRRFSELRPGFVVAGDVSSTAADTTTTL